MADPLMRAYVQLLPDVSGMRQRAQADVKTALSGVEGQA